MTKRVVAYIDGFNVYHAIANNLPDKYKWLDYRKFVQNFLDADDSLVNIIFFTATPSWDPVRVLRHNAYMSILVGHLGIKIVAGNYTNVIRKFKGDRMPVVSPEGAIVHPEKFSYKTYEEKQTDVNIALSILEGTVLDHYDKALIFSGDSDIAPGIIKLKRYCSMKGLIKEFHCVIPYKGRGKVIATSCDKLHITTQSILDNCLLENSIDVYGKVIVNPYLILP